MYVYVCICFMTHTVSLSDSALLVTNNTFFVLKMKAAEGISNGQIFFKLTPFSILLSGGPFTPFLFGSEPLEPPE